MHLSPLADSLYGKLYNLLLCMETIKKVNASAMRSERVSGSPQALLLASFHIVFTVSTFFTNDAGVVRLNDRLCFRGGTPIKQQQKVWQVKINF